MEAFFVVVVASISYVILYFIIKAAVRNGIIEARRIDNESDNIGDEETYSSYTIGQTTCPNCGKKHDIDYPKCPYCDN